MMVVNVMRILHKGSIVKDHISMNAVQMVDVAIVDIALAVMNAENYIAKMLVCFNITFQCKFRNVNEFVS